MQCLVLKGYSHAVLFVCRVSSKLLKRDRNDKERKAYLQKHLGDCQQAGVCGLLRRSLPGRGFQCR
jgi:hypothetical protein